MKIQMIIPQIVLIVFLASCSLLQGKNDPSTEFIAGKSENLKISLNDLEEALTDYGSMGAGTYKMRVTVLTPTFLQMRDHKMIAQNEVLCFAVSLKVINQAKYAYFDEWTAKAFISEKEEQIEFPLEWTKESLQSKPQTKLGASFHGKTEQYFNNGTICSLKPIDLNKGLVLKFFPSYIQWPFDGSLDLSWDFIEPGAKSLKKAKERYRGW